ncbi:hypothetical protein [Acetivibrio ethanolgignens]|uniref:hypothetical protein n=1 Tax=Acetivibrio ethanolgignens TaxID=290052 RepID=UPI0012DDB0B7|nr:hypothetical protein [Acetivibrio ethanolgignens]
MENGLELFYEGFGATLFCMAVAVMLYIFSSLHGTEEMLKQNLEENHIISVTVIE